MYIIFPFWGLSTEAYIIVKSTVQALDTLGNTKWRINKRVFGVVDRIWAGGGCLAEMVDCNDVSYFISFSLIYIFF